VRTLEKEIVTDLPAGEWTRLVTDLTLSGVSGQDTAYLTVGATFSAATSATGAIYVDDMQVQEYVDFSGLDYQSYEGFEAKRHPASDTGIAGNGDGREVSADYNHTPGGFHAIKLTSVGAKSTYETPQTVVLTPDGSRQTFEKGKTYTLTAWLYTAKAVSVKYRIASVKNPNDVSWGVRTMEKETVLDLPAGVWTPVETKITIVGVSGQDTAYLALGVTFATATSDTGYFYVDDVKATEVITPGFTYGLQNYEEYEVKIHGQEDTGIHGNGSGREVSAEQNHTAGGTKSVKLNVNNYNIDYYARTVLPLNGTDHPVSRGDCYTLSFWLYSDAEREITWLVGSTVSATNLYAGKNNEEQKGTVTLPAGVWTKITTQVIVKGHSADSTAFLTVGARFAGCDTKPAFIYLDDVELLVPDDLITVNFHADGGSAVESRKAFAGTSLGYLNASTKAGYLFGGWYNGTTLYTAETALPTGVSVLDLTARWVAVPATPQSLTTGFEENEYTANPYENDDPTTAVSRGNMTATATWMKDAGFNAETGDGALRLVNDPFVQENGTAYHAVALMNPDGTPFVVKAGSKYRLTYSYRCDELPSAHSYVGAAVSSATAGDGFGNAQKLSRHDIHGVAEEWGRAEESFVALQDGYIYLTLCARISTSESSSKGHAVYLDNVIVEVLDGTCAGITFIKDGTVYATRAGVPGAAVAYPATEVPAGYELEGFYTDAAFTHKYETAVYPAVDTTLYARVVEGDYDTPLYVQDGLTLDFEEGFLPTYYSASNHLTQDNGQLSYVSGDVAHAHSGNGYLRANPVSWNYNQSYALLYDPTSPHGILYLEPNASYMVRFYVNQDNDFNPFRVDVGALPLGGVSDNAYEWNKITQEVVQNEWTQVSGVLATGDQPTALALRFNTYVMDSTTPTVLLDDLTVLRLTEVTVTFDSNGGEKVEPITGTLYGTVEAPADPYREGYEFLGWYTDKALKNTYDFATPLQGDLLLYAKWRPITMVTPSAPSAPAEPKPQPPAEPEETPGMDIGQRPTFIPPEQVPADKPAGDTPTPEGTTSVQLVLILIAAVVVVAGGAVLTFLLLRRRKRITGEEA